MRLLNIHTLQFADFASDDLPPYTIASHRWGEDETTYQYVERRPRTDLARGASKRQFSFEAVSDIPPSAGFKKVQAFCKTIASLNYTVLSTPPWKVIGLALRCDWLWIDTACIDKTNSAELSESLNSMFKWYRNAAVCYAYLKDVRSTNDYQGAMLDLMRSEWFHRGWTLQELLTPGVVVFLTTDWKVLGHKCPYDEIMCEIVCHGFGQRLDLILSRITRIPLHIIRNYANAKNVSIAERMTWIQSRITTRLEDKAYSLLGIMDVFMSPIYGEGEHAWDRLLAAIDKREEDCKLIAKRTATMSQDHRWPFENMTLPLSSLSPSISSDFTPRSRTHGGQRHRVQIAWSATTEAQTVPRSKTQTTGCKDVVQALKFCQVTVQPGSLGPVLTPQDLERWRQSCLLWRNPMEQQCGHCHGNIYSDQIIKCDNVYCKNPIYHRRCASRRVDEPVWCCDLCRDSMEGFAAVQHLSLDDQDTRVCEIEPSLFDGLDSTTPVLTLTIPQSLPIVPMELPLASEGTSHMVDHSSASNLSSGDDSSFLLTPHSQHGDVSPITEPPESVSPELDQPLDMTVNMLKTALTEANRSDAEIKRIWSLLESMTTREAKEKEAETFKQRCRLVLHKLRPPRHITRYASRRQDWTTIAGDEYLAER
ncbi:Vegetative incompatibility protein HET-E-1 [Fulvia fulva]|uniref:Vegetative incompatibility protein HET-E-1 n=1 Tax=Passalora fulva TaxID=5499 RepID=A0A9Q8LEP0_PASFU|nr:Vegetative incompatibility protein HET-E-1 [Fulvia fulva]KAK4628835.1 Vegetative incompatibility protein HET-E-1 [Fulvia fulva]KAK4630549.1 Vegetative incompatibility protein HET-E-1 [Fulvia fulva]UJO15308.1 Vegetative incompatibility protein HET-E-1 [Fulvia fulva]WPV12232.1 Vegetative incompatibility protein HET-E-1 [Fulvia fulva]WPV27391.1 Vegetative incompatibility protein HET-E-1 [Fulvia fulva]